MEFAVKTVYDRRDTCALVRAYAWLKTYERPLGKLRRALAVLAGALAAYAGARTLCSLGDMRTEIDGEPGMFLAAVVLPGVGLTVLGILMVLGWRGKWLNARIAWNGYREKETRIVYTLTPEQFYERLPASGHRLEYTLITAVLEDRERFFLVMGTQAHILKKSDFVEGDPENFRRFICEVTGKTVKFVT